VLGEDLELTTTALAAGGDGLARAADGRVVFVEGALPGETVRARVTDDRRDFLRANTLEVLEASAFRVTAPCPAVAEGCGGCQWQHVAPAAQAGLKVSIVVDALRRIAKTEAPDIGVSVLSPDAYRTTARMAVEQGRAGHRRRHGHDVVTSEDCLVAHPLLQDLVVHGGFGLADEVVLRVAVSTKERAALPSPADAQVELPLDVAIGKRARVHEVVAGRRWRISIRSFFQSGPGAAELVIAAVDRLALDASSIVDAYAGVGLLGGVLAERRGASLVAVESNASAAADARHNLADLDAEVVEAEVGAWAAASADLVIADPARSGLGRPGVRSLVGTEAARLVLVSCDPASLARDVRLLADAGYGLEQLEVVDVFPHTFHVETVAAFVRGSAR
jgi:23S rRNA (uracil1939-C5)-methyltransferase